MMRVPGVLIAILSLLFTPGAAVAGDKTPLPETLGYVEWVVLEHTGLRLKARLDTGAKTSSLHAKDIEPFEKNGERWVRFSVPLGDHKDQPAPDGADHENVVMTYEEPVARTVLIKRKGAPSQRRYVIRKGFCISGTRHETQFSLTDRGNFSYPVLLGRRFMGDDNVLVDSADSFLAKAECPHRTLSELAESPYANVR
jgi:hypothetical protein